MKINDLITDEFMEGEEIQTETYLLKIAPGIAVWDTDLAIDNTQFISNKIENTVTEKADFEAEVGVIYFALSEYETCNITNCVFKDNDPANFIIENNKIVLKNMPEINDEQMTDGYIPNSGNVTIYYDENTIATTSQLKSNNQEIWVEGSRIPIRVISNTHIESPLNENNCYLENIQIRK